MDLGPTLLDTWKACGGYYKCPEGPNGELLGPLVGYAGTYRDGAEDKHWVGKEYYNFAKVEAHHRAVDDFADIAINNYYKLPSSPVPDVILGAPMGGIIFAQAVARHMDVRTGFADKKVTKAAQGGQREESVLQLDRHEIKPGELVLLAEDVTNNFSTTNQLVTLIERAGGEVLGIICALNRSPLTMYHPSPSDLPLPVASALHIETPQYRQDYGLVADYIAKGQIVWKPKDNWTKLAEAMAAYA
jgi:adenine/guanine phosphoribosyltransferase-like PRPP-binding protein